MERIKANELRIGNWITVHNNEGEIDLIDGCGVVGVKGVHLIQIEYIQPIPLTEDWLFKLGFEKKGQLYIKEFFGDYIGVDVDDFSVGTYVFDRITHAPQPTFMKVHQLQNLYFALTGEELTLKDNEQSK